MVQAPIADQAGAVSDERNEEPPLLTDADAPPGSEGTPPPTDSEAPNGAAADPLARLRTEGLDLVELLKVEVPPTRWLVEGLIQAEATTCFFGPPNSGKTFLVVECVALALAADARVLFFEEEGSVADIQQRLRRAAAAHGLSEEQMRNLTVLHSCGIDLATNGGTARVLEIAARLRPHLIVLDSLAAMTGGVDENSTAEWGRIANTLNLIKVQTRAAVVPLHHMNKDAWEQGKVPTLRSLRGSGTLPGRLDVALAIVQGKKEDAGLQRLAVAEAQMVELLRKAGAEGMPTEELRGLASGSSETKNSAVRSLILSGQAIRTKKVKGRGPGPLVLASFFRQEEGSDAS